MSFLKTVSAKFFPKQAAIAGKKVSVCLFEDPNQQFFGEVIRDDLPKPQNVLIQLESGRMVLGHECVYDVMSDVEIKELERRREIERDKLLKAKMTASKELDYSIREILLDDDTKHVVIGAISARDYLDFDNYPHLVVAKDRVITEPVFERLIAQGSHVVEIKEAIKRK